MTILRRSQDETLSAVVVIDEEAYSPLKSVQTAAKTATAASKAFEIGAQIRIETFYRMGLPQTQCLGRTVICRGQAVAWHAALSLTRTVAREL